MCELLCSIHNVQFKKKILKIEGKKKLKTKQEIKSRNRWADNSENISVAEHSPARTRPSFNPQHQKKKNVIYHLLPFVSDNKIRISIWLVKWRTNEISHLVRCRNKLCIALTFGMMTMFYRLKSQSIKTKLLINYK